jgi:hypothetical protein
MAIDAGPQIFWLVVPRLKRSAATRNDRRNYSPGLLDAITVTGMSR